MKITKRQDLLKRFYAKRANKDALLIGDIGIGITAKMAEKAGIDMLEATTLGIFRMRGVDDEVSFRPHGECNEMTMALIRRLRHVVDETPVLAGIGAADPAMELDEHLDSLLKCGVSGVTNLPSASVYDGNNRRNIDNGGMGFPEELKMIRRCRERGMFTLGHGFFESDLLALTEAGADMVCINLRYFVEKLTTPELFADVERVCEGVQQTCERVKAINPQVLVTVHAGPFVEPESIKKLYALTDADGLVASSIIDAVPVSTSVAEVVAGFLDGSLR